MAVSCYGQSEVNVIWYPYQATILTGLHRAPNGVVVEVVEKGRRLGRQSLRNPDRDAWREERPSRDGFVWCYEVESGRAGWVELTHLRADSSIKLARAGETYCGPANVDAQAGQKPKAKRNPDKKPEPHSGLYAVKVEDMMLRHAPHGSAFEWLEKGDVVTARKRVTYGKELDYCVEVLKSSTARVGATGWILALGLRRL